MQNIKIFNQSDSPWKFRTFNQIEQWTIEYRNLIEFNQGSPLIGHLYINGRELSKNILFGSPFIYSNDYIYVLMFIKRFCLSGFVLSEVNLTTTEICSIGKIKDLIYLNCMENGTIRYYTDLDRTKEGKIFIQ